MLSHSTYFAVSGVLAGLAFVLTPGPSMLALLALVAERGRTAGWRYLTGQTGGDLFWMALGLGTVLGVSQMGATLSAALAIAGGLFLCHLGLRSLLSSDGPPPSTARGPFATGAAMGLTNPKSYPVFVALFGAVAAGRDAPFTVASAASCAAALLAGYAAGSVAILVIADLAHVRRFYLRHRRIVARITGAFFIAVGGRLMWDGLAGLRGASR